VVAGAISSHAADPRNEENVAAVELKIEATTMQELDQMARAS
jgi:hypothetical protein